MATDDEIDELFNKAKLARKWRDLSDEDLRKFQFESSDPESVEGLSLVAPENEGTPEIEFAYDMRAQKRFIRCVYCKKPNHYIGIVVVYPSGTRNLVGRCCAVERHGADFQVLVREFDAGRERQDYVLRKTAVLELRRDLFDAMSGLRAHPAVKSFTEVRTTWRDLMGSMWTRLIEVAHGTGKLVLDREIRDFAAGERRAEKLGPLDKSERKRLRRQGKLAPIMRTVTDDLGPLGGIELFVTGESVERRLDAIENEMRVSVYKLGEDGLSTSEIRRHLIALGEMPARLRVEFDRLAALAAAFHPVNLGRIAAWCNERARTETPAPSVNERRSPSRPVGSFGSFEARGDTFVRADERGEWSARLPTGFHLPSKRLIEVLEKATAIQRPTP